MKPIKIFYSIPDKFPAFRVDIVELFSVSLKQLGVTTIWLMQASLANRRKQVTLFENEACILPAMLSSKWPGARLINKLLFWMQDVWTICKQASTAVDILQVRDKYIVALAGLLAARCFSKKLVYWCSYPFPEHYAELANISDGLKKIYYMVHAKLAKWTLYSCILPHCDHVFVQSEQMKQNLVRLGIASSQMTVVPMGVPERLLNWHTQHHVQIVPFRLVYIGIMTPERHLEMVLNAFAIIKQQVPQASLLMVGDGVHPSERQQLEQHALALGLKDAVTFTGFVPIATAWQYAASASVCLSPIYPSDLLNAGSPTKLYEYMALARPVVCNYQAEQSQVIADSQVGVCVDWDAESFAEACIWMLTHQQEAEQMASRGPSWVALHRSYPQIAKTVYNKYLELVYSIEDPVSS